MNYQRVRGTRDIYGKEGARFLELGRRCEDLFRRYGYAFIATPTLENVELFTRSIGSSSDIVGKEMYVFTDKGGRELALRPEITAGVVRLACENKLLQPGKSLRLCYNQDCYRYERPGEGRLRQFRQVGVELLGKSGLSSDLELINLGAKLLYRLGLPQIEIRLNHLGDQAARTRYSNDLKAYLEKQLDKMCPDCQRRFHANTLRILDCKVKADQGIVKNAPILYDYLSDEQKQHLEQLITALQPLPVVLDKRLVRGLDYYSDIVFEFYCPDPQAMQLGALGAGGTYKDLIAQIDPRHELPGCGFAFGLDRLQFLLDHYHQEEHPHGIYIAPLTSEAEATCRQAQDFLTDFGHKTVMHLQPTSPGKAIKAAVYENCHYLVIIGEDELKKGLVTVRDLVKEEQKAMSLGQLALVLEE